MVRINRTHLGNLVRVLHLIITFRFCVSAGECPLKGCDLAYASFRIAQNTNYTYIGGLFDNQINTTILQLHNPRMIINDNYFRWGDRIKIPFSCDCLTLPNGTPYLGHVFNYTVRSGDTYFKIAHDYYSNLTSGSWLQAANVYDAKSLPIGKSINVSINCSCGDETTNKDYGLFLTYPLMNSTSDTLSALSKTFNVSPETLRLFNPGVTFRAFNDEIVYIPMQDLSGSYHPLYKSAGLSKAAIVGICIATVIAVFVISLVVYFFVYKRAKTKDSLLLQLTDKNGSSYIPGSYKELVSIGGVDVTVDKSVEFTFEELALATDNFSLANKIGEGGFGCVYYAELHGEKAAIKKMGMKATHEFMAELKVLTHVHHLNLVRLIGFCTEECLFLVYEFIENGTLSQHLRGSGMEPLSWPSRVQIALDSARGLEYIHEHTVPVYIHRDIKSANILIDKNYRAKVADFGLTKLTEVGDQSASLSTALVGTFGYMPPEYALYADVSPKVDVYAFGVVLYEIISAKEAIVRTNDASVELKAAKEAIGSTVRTNDASVELKGLVTLFEDVWRSSNGREILRDLADPRLGNNYPLESVWKMAQLAKACTNEEAHKRPNMRTVVVTLMTLSSSTEEWYDGSLSSIYQSKGHARLMSGRVLSSSRFVLLKSVYDDFSLPSTLKRSDCWFS